MEKDNDSELVHFAEPVKALGDGKVGGYLVRFTSEQDPDLTGDYFAPDTYYGKSVSVDVYYNHGFDDVLKRRIIGEAAIRPDDVGLWAEAQLSMRDEYERKIYELAEAGKLGWSSGSAGHLVERDGSKITRWPITEASLTPTPAEPRNGVIPLKSLVASEAPSGDKPVNNENKTLTPAETPKESEMEKEELVGLLEGFKADIKTEFDNAVKKFAENQPEVKAGFVTDVKDEADRALEGNPFSAGEFFKAVKNAALAPHAIDQRLLPLKATGLNEAIPSQGGFLVPAQVAAGIFQRMYPVGSILARVNPIGVQGNSMTFNTVDETSRLDGYRYGGIQGYWLNEAGTKTSSKPTFAQIELKLKKVAALCYATDELLEDTAALESWITTYVPEELRFKVEDAFINGDGVGKPLGVLNSTALVSATRTDASEIDANDIARMWARRWVGVQDYVWLCNPDIMPQLMAMTTGQIPVFMPPGGMTQAPYGSLMGRPIVENEYCPTLGTLGDLLLFSPSQYLAIQKGGGVQSASSIHVAFTTDETAFRFVFRVDGQPAWSSALTPFKGSNTVSPYVALAAST